MLETIFDYRLVFDLIKEMVFVLNDNLEIISVNKAAADRLKLEPDSLKIKQIKTLLKSKVWESFFSSLSINGEVELNDIKITLTDKSEIDVNLHAAKVETGSNSVTILVINDITSYKKEKLELLRFSNALHFAANPIQITDANGIMVYVNPAFEKASGYCAGELLGHNPKILSNNKLSKEFWEKVWQKILSGKVWVGQIENRRKNGTLFSADSIISPILDNDGSIAGFLGVHNETSNNNVIKNQLECIQRLGSLGTLTAGIAHEIGNPLTSISSITQLIQKTTNDKIVVHKLDLVKNQINRISNIIRQLVDFSRPVLNNDIAVEINKALVKAVNMIKIGKEKSKIQYVLTLDQNIPDIKFSADQLMQVFINLLLNAADAIGTDAGKIIILTKKFEEHIEISIRDSGTGIPAEKINKIFEPFYSTKQAGKGIGLGLWVSYGIIRNMGGDIFVESREEVGSEFKIVLPYPQSNN